MKAIINYEHAGFVFPDTRLFNCTAGPRENPGASAVIALRLIPTSSKPSQPGSNHFEPACCSA